MSIETGTAPAAADALAGGATLRALYELAVAAAGVRAPGEVARLAVERARELLRADGAVLYAFEISSGLLRPIMETGAIEETPLAPGEGAIGLAFQGGIPVAVTDYAAWDAAIPESAARGMASVLAVPLIAEGRPLAAIGIWSIRFREFSADETQVLELLASHVAPLLQSALATAEVERKARMFEALHDIAVAAGGVLVSEEVAALAVERARELLGVDGGGVWWWNPQAGVLDSVVTTGPPMSASSSSYAPGEGMVGRAFASRWAAWAQRSEKVGGGVAVPMLAGDRPVGAVAVWSQKPRRFEPDEVQLVSLVAAQLAPALESAQLAEGLEEQARTFVALHDLAVAAGGVLEPAQLARLAAERALALLNLDHAALYWSQSAAGQLQFLASSGSIGTRRLRSGQGVAGLAYQSGAPVVVDDYQHWEHSSRWAKRRGFQSALAVPLMINDMPVGAFCGFSLQQRAFGPEDVRLLSLVAAQVAPAVEAARLHAGLARSEERFRSLYERLACGILVQGPDLKVMEANSGAEEILGLRLRQMKGRTPDQLWQTEPEPGGASRPDEQALETGRPVRDAVSRITRRDGQPRWVQVDSVPVLASDGARLQVISSLIDVTERWRAEAALRASEGRFRTVFDRAAIGICRIGLDGGVIEANPALCAMLRRSAAEMAAANVADLVAQEDHNPDLTSRLVRGRLNEFQAELRCLRRDGDVMWGRVTATLVRDERGEPSLVIAMVEDITTHKAHEEVLAHQATHDALTDLPNRVLLHDRIEQAIQLSQREDQSMALLMMDLDRFKEVNDTFGHHVGDLLLREVAKRLRGQLRGSDTVARLGGDEFAFVLLAVDGELGAAQAASKLLKSLESPFVIAGERLEVGASIGIALHPEQGEDADTLMRRADVAMFVAKRAGSGFSVYAPDDDVHTADRMALVAELHDSIDQGQLRLAYQMRVEVAGLRVTGVEAQLRWPHPVHGVMLPDAFVPMAEQTGLIRPLELWALDEALRQVAAWAAEGLDLTVAVNLSMRSLHEPQLPEMLEERLRAAGAQARSLQIEITESTLLANPELALRVLTRLHAIGIRLAVDDFATGYASLSYLKRLPIDEIKIDRSFVGEMATEKDAAAIVLATIELGHDLGLRVVAEGVEDHAAWQMLEEAGCDLVQGNLFGRPLEADEVTRRLKRSLKARPGRASAARRSSTG